MGAQSIQFYNPQLAAITSPKNLSPMPRKEHRGRIQAQGDGLEASESWHQSEPLSKKQGLSLLKRLRNKLSPGERAARRQQFEDAERFINQVEGGIDAPTQRSFLNRKTRDVRVDIEVWSGTAFIIIVLLIGIALWIIL